MLNVDWSAIQSLNGSKAGAFEELCAQLARATRPLQSAFHRKGTPDAGVECFAVLTDGTEWGWQAKYFSTIGDSQWSQLDESVQTALDKHPALKRYFVCVPRDLPDARLEKQKSAKQRWDERVAKWAGWAAERHMDVDFVWQGSHELLDLLAKPEHVSRVRFFFDTFTVEHRWFERRLSEAIAAAGPRYTPELNVSLPIADDLESFGRTDAFFNRVRMTARPIRDAQRTFGYTGPPEALAELRRLCGELQAACDRVVGEFTRVSGDATGQGLLDSLAEALRTSVRIARQVEDELRHERSKPEVVAQSQKGAYGAASERWDRHLFDRLYRVTRALSDALEVVECGRALANSNLVLLSGEAGTGKTHLMCDLAKQRLTANKPTVLLMGQRFLSTADPWTQALQQLDVSNWSADEFVGALEVAGEIAGCRVLVIVDAVNEGAGLRFGHRT